MQRRPRPQRQGIDANRLFEKLKRPQYALPGAIVIGMLALAFGVQPGTSGHAEDVSTALITSASPTAAASLSPTPAATKTAPAASSTAGGQSAQHPAATAQASASPQSDVAGVRSTPSTTATVDPALQTQPTQCGELKESTTAVNVEQAISGVSIKATKVAVYPIEYFRCILMATGGQEAYGLAQSVSKAELAGQTHVAVLDLWVANGSKQFGQVNVRNATLSVAGQSFTPTATLGGRSEVVVSSGQGRNLSLVFAIKNSVGASTGPMTLVVDGPLNGGAQLAGKYQLFLPTP